MASQTNWRWVSRRILETLHSESLALHGGAYGVCDEGLLESALARPQQLAYYGDPDVFELAASTAFGLAKNHAFVDGNKRAAFLGMGLFLRLNGYKLMATQVDAALTIFALAAGELNEVDLAKWIEQNSISC